MTEYDEQRLERLMREGLAERAAQADTTVPLELTGRPRDRRWRTPVLAAVGVAASLLVAVPLVVAQSGGDDGPPPPGTSQTPDQTTTDGLPGDWRVESYRHVQVQVPPEWGWGGTPSDDGGGPDLIDCGAAAFVVPGDPDYEFVPEGSPYVGRPVMMTDACTTFDPDSPPEPGSPYVWLDSPFEEGMQGWSNGYEAETITVAGQNVTVATEDAALRRQILATVEPGQPTDPNRCPAVQPEVVVPGGEVSGDVEGLAVCVYDPADAGGKLFWSGLVGGGRAADFVSQVEGASAVYDTAELCEHPPEPGLRVFLYVYSTDGMALFAVDFRCKEILMPFEARAPLLPETVEPWALGGIRAYLTGPTGYEEEDLAGFFRPGLG